MPRIKPDEPFIAKDWIEYEDLAAYLAGQPIRSWRNNQIQRLLLQGDREVTRQWVRFHDDIDPSDEAESFASRAARCVEEGHKHGLEFAKRRAASRL